MGKIDPNGNKIKNRLLILFKNYLENRGMLLSFKGSAFGLDGYFRISYATSMNNLKKAMYENKIFLRRIKLMLKVFLALKIHSNCARRIVSTL